MIKQIHITCILIAGLLCATAGSFAQGVGIGTSTPNSSALLDISNTSKGILIPRMSATQRSAIASPATGLLVFQNNGTPGFYYFNGVNWVNLTSGYQPNSSGLAVSPGYRNVSTLVQPSGLDPRGLAADAAGYVYVADHDQIIKITPDGVITMLAGGGGGIGGVDGPGATASFSAPSGVAVDAQGYVYVADYNNNKIRKIAPNGMVTTLAGSGTAGATDATGTAASFDNPYRLALDAAGNVYVVDQGNYKIRKITPAGVVTTLAGTGSRGNLDGTGTAASFYLPGGIAVDASNNVYVSDGGTNTKIRKITPAGVVTTLAGNSTASYADGTGTTARFNNPQGMAIDAAGNLYIADQNNQRIRAMTLNGLVVTTLAGTGATGFWDGYGPTAVFNYPTDVAIDAAGNLYVSDVNNHSIRKIITR